MRVNTMNEFPKLEDYPVHRGDIAEEIRVLGALGRFKRKIGFRGLLSGDLSVGIVSVLQGIGFYRCWELPVVETYFRP